MYSVLDYAVSLSQLCCPGHGVTSSIFKFTLVYHQVCSAILSGAPNDNFLSDPLKRYLRRSGVALKLFRFILGSAIIFLSVRSF